MGNRAGEWIKWMSGAFIPVKPFVNRLADCLFPSNIYCISCGNPVGTDALYSMCDSCLESFDWVGVKNCRVCGRPLEDWYPDELCGECVNMSREFDKGISCTQYKEPEREMIREFKYHGKAWMADKMTDIMADRLDAEYIEGDLVVPVPMYRKKEKKRGYNQTVLLAKLLAKKTNLVYHKDILIRTRETEPMNSLNSSERRENVKGVFAVDPVSRHLIEGRKILLLDDIFTTGATADECSIVLKEAGASEVLFMSFASGGNQRELPPVSYAE